MIELFFFFGRCFGNQNNDDNELGLRIDSVYSQQEENDCDGEFGFRIDNVYSEQEQSDGDNFNRGKLRNVGYVEALKVGHTYSFLASIIPVLPFF